MTAQEHYDHLDGKQRQVLLLTIGETRAEAQLLSQRDYVALNAEPPGGFGAGPSPRDL